MAYLPAGINEWHGEQSACGLDALKAETLCEMAAHLLGGVSFPTLWLGPDASTPFDPAKYPRGTLTIDKPAYDAAAGQILTSLQSMGFKVVVYLSGHYPGVIPEVAARFNQAGHMKVISISENEVVRGMPAGDHAAAWETSVLMLLRPGLVDLTKLPPLPATTRPAGEVIPPDYDFRQRTEVYGIYRLDPRIWANRYYGRRGVEAVIDGLAREVSTALGDPNYGADRHPIRWPTDDRQNPEVRYDHLLPGQWLQRFQQAPIVYIPLAPADESIAPVTARAIEWARTTGGMVFPPIAYGPATSHPLPRISPDTYAAVVGEIVADLADMNFRVVALVPSPTLSAEAQARLAEIKSTSGQFRVVMSDPEQQQPSGITAASAPLIPDQGQTIELDGPWRLNGQDTLSSLSENIYGPGDTRVYEYELTCSPEESRKGALLDLGRVCNRAEVVINESPAVVDHWPPYQVVVSGLLRPGINRVRIAVKNSPQPTLDYWYFQPGLPRLHGPVTLTRWQIGE